MDAGTADDPARHHDRGRWLARFAGEILVACPKCGGRAVVVLQPGLPALKTYDQLLVLPRRLVCSGCAAVAAWEPEVRGGPKIGVHLGGSEEPFFGRPLWLQTRCVGQVLWAYNVEHINELAAYVGAQLRERGPYRPTRSMFARLPSWVKASDNRTEVLAGLERLKALAERSAQSDRSDAAHERGDHPRS